MNPLPEWGLPRGVLCSTLNSLSLDLISFRNFYLFAEVNVRSTGRIKYETQGGH